MPMSTDDAVTLTLARLGWPQTNTCDVHISDLARFAAAFRETLAALPDEAKKASWSYRQNERYCWLDSRIQDLEEQVGLLMPGWTRRPYPEAWQNVPELAQEIPPQADDDDFRHGAPRPMHDGRE